MQEDRSHSYRNLRCVYTNADQLANKRDDLEMAISHSKPDIIFITECLPKVQSCNTDMSILALPGYRLFTNFSSDDGHRTTKGSRGVCIYVADGIQASETTFARTHSVEHLWINLQLKNSDILTAGCVYRSPLENAHESVDEIVHLLHSVLAANSSHLLICGDFNIPQVDWISSFSSAPDAHFSHKFLDAVHSCLLFQHVTRPTRFREGERPSVLDLLFTNEEGMLMDLQYLPGLGKSDQVTLWFQLACYTHQTSAQLNRLNFNRAKWSDLNAMLDKVNWLGLKTLSIESGYRVFQEHLSDAVSTCIPTAKNSKARKNIFMTSKALRLKKHKNRLWKRCMFTQDPLDMARFKASRNKLRSLTRNLRQTFERRLVSDIKRNPRAFWRYSNTRIKTRPVMGALRSSTGETVNTDKRKADILNTFFASVFTQEEDLDLPVPTAQEGIPELSDIEISAEGVERKLLALNQYSAPGPDSIHPQVLREARHVLSTPLSILYRRSLDTGSVPHAWKLGRVVPIFKKGDRKEPSNYRPVSLTSVTCKVLESLIRDRLLQHLQDNDLLADNQYGFRPKRSCATQLLKVLEDWTTMLESRNPLDVVYLDFQKAFDSVPHQRLLLKLQSYGVSGKLLKWIESFLVNRRQQVVLHGSSSDWSEVVSGVPQGSVLGPLLFLVYVNDLPRAVHSCVAMFADDTKLYSSVSTPQHVCALQADLDELSRWSDTWQLPFNQGKCKVLHMGNSNNCQTYTICGAELSMTEVEKDLGVHIDTELKFRHHASAVVAKATQIMSVIRRSFALIDMTTLPLLFKSLVRPHLEYGNLVWGPFNRADQKIVERVQRRATRMVPNIRHLSYPERLQRLQLPSLYYRRKRGDMIHMYQLFHGGIDSHPEDFFTLAKDFTTRGHPYKVEKPRAVRRVRRSAFSVRVVNDWNALPVSVVCAASVNSFKARLDAHWAQFWYTIPDND